MVGGETCDGSGRNDSAGVTVQSEMAALNFTEINLDYWVGNINIWKAANLSASGNDPAETAFVRLQRKMGYRLRLVDATFPTSATAGAGFTFSANLSNDGYAGLIKPRPIFLVFTNSAYRFNLPLSNVDVRTWLSGPVTLSQQTVTLPANMPAGTYKLALWLPDYYPGLQSRPDYSIRLANQGLWDSGQGYNVLSTAISITGSGSATATPMPTNTSTPSPTNTPTTTPTPMGYAAYEAESGSNTLAGGAVVAACGPCSGGNKVGYVGNNAGTLQFNGVSTSNGGNYTLTIYYTNGDSVSRSATVSVNGGTGTSLNFPTTGGWTTVGSIQTTVSLNAGSSNTIKFSNATGWAPDFDRITINASGGATSTPAPTATQTNTPVPPTNTPTRTNTPTGPTNTPTNTPLPPTNTPTWTPTGTPPGPTATPTNTPVATATPTNTPTRTNTPIGPTNTPTNTPSGGTTYEAEAAGNTLGGGATIQNCTACSGGQRVNSLGWGINNAYLIFNNVNVATAGNHTVVVYYTNGNNTSLTFHADPNGASGPTTTVPSNGGFDWTQPVLSVSITVNLNAGNNTIRIWDTNKAPDIDRIVVQ